MEKIDALEAGVKAMRSTDVEEAEQAMLDKITNVLTNYKDRRALGDSSKNLPVQHDDDLRTADTFRHAPHSRRLSEATLDLEVRTLPEPYRERLNDANERVKRAVYRTTPIPKRVAPRMSTQVDGTDEEGASCDSPCAGITAAGP